MPIKWKVDESDGNFVLVGQWEHGCIIGQWGADGSDIAAVQPDAQSVSGILRDVPYEAGESRNVLYVKAPSGRWEYREVAAQRLATGQWETDGGAIAAVQPAMHGIPIGENADGSSVYPEDVLTKESRKGKFALVCAHPSCSCEPARWHADDTDGFGQAGGYYCEGCATDINRRVSLMHPDRGPACHLV